MSITSIARRLLAKDDRLDLVGQQVGGQAHALLHHAAADAEVFIHDRRVVDQEVLGAARRTILVHQFNPVLDQLTGQLDRVGNRGRGQDEIGVRAVKLGDPLQTAQHIGDMRAKHAPVGVHLVDHDVLQVGKELGPLGVVRQDPGMEHIRVGDDDPGILPHFGPGRLGGIAVVGASGDVQFIRQAGG